MTVYVRIIFEGKSGATGTDASGTVALTVHLEDGDKFVTQSASWAEVPGTVGKYWFFPSLGSTGSSDEIAHIYLDDWRGFAYARNNYGFTNNKVTSRYYPSDTGAPHCHGYDIHYCWWNNGYLDNEITDSILHEYAHALMYGMYGGAFADSDCSTVCGPQPGGCNYGIDCWNHGGSNNKCSCDAVTEGWARFFPTMIHNDPVYNWESYTSGTDIDDEANTQGEKNEYGFGGILWDIWEDVDSKNTYNIFHAMEVHDPGTVQQFYDGYAGNKNALCPIFAKHGIGATATYWRCAGDTYCDCTGTSYCDGNAGWCDSAQPQQGCNLPYPAGCDCWDHGITKVCSHISPDNYCWSGCGYWRSCGYAPCGGTGCPGALCWDCATGWCDADQPGQGCNGVYPSQCNCYGHGVTSVCSNAPAYVYCVSGCWVNPCACAGAGCPGAGCYTCTTGWCDADSPDQGCNGAWPSQCDCYRHGVTSVCSNAPAYVYCVSGCWKNPCACSGVGCPGTGCYTCAGTVVDTCECGGWNCVGEVTCGYEFDCAAYAIDDFMPCGGTVPAPCVCGGIGCACIAGAECPADPEAWKPCGGVTPCACGGVGCACFDYCYLAPPSSEGWTLLATDPDEGAGTNLKEIRGQRYSGLIYFKVEHYRFWPSITSIDTAIFIDADQNPGTGQPGNAYPNQNTGIGADYLIIVGAEGTEMWPWGGSSWDTANPIDLAYLYAPSNASMFVVGIRPADLPPTAAIDCAVVDAFSSWDWMTDTGYFTLPVAWTPCGGTVVDTCDCGGVGCDCGSENDCAAFAVNNFMPCGGATVIPCVCGRVGCACFDYCYLAPPSSEGWTLLATDPDEGIGTGLARIHGQRYPSVIYFRVEHYRPWTTIADIDTAILVDSDQNPSTGMPDGAYPNQMTGIGADYLIVVGNDGTVMYRWVGSSWDTANPIDLAYLYAPDGSNVFEVGVYLADVVTVGALDCAVTDPFSSWDWMPNSGHFTLSLAWTPCASATTDVAARGVTSSKTVVGQGYPLLIDVTVENHGACTESFNLTVYYGNAAITPEQWEDFWSLGDVNRDGYINGIDQNLLSAAFGSTPGSANWNPWADLNQDLQVNMIDISTFAYHYGLQIWTYAISGGVIGTLPVIDLAAGTTQTLTYTWDTSGIPYGNYVIGGYAVPILGNEPPLGREIDRADNTFADGTVTVTIPGDIDGDGDVDYGDFIILAGAYGSSTGEPAYNPQASIDGDDDVDYGDFIILAGNYGKSIP